MAGESEEKDLNSDKKLMLSAIEHGLDGISVSQSSIAINLNEIYVDNIRQKMNKGEFVTEEQKKIVSLHDIQSGRFRGFFTKCEETKTREIQLTSEFKKDIDNGQ